MPLELSDVGPASSARVPSQNLAFYRSEAFHRIVLNAQTEPDPARRTVLYEQAQKLAHDDAVWVPLVHTTQLVALAKNVRGYSIHPTAKERFHKVRFE